MSRSRRRKVDDELDAPEGQRKLQHQFQISGRPAKATLETTKSGGALTPRQRDAHKELEEVINVITKPRRPATAIDGNDEIEEYAFSSEEDDTRHDDGYDSEAAQSHISVSSSESPEQARMRYAIDERPWLHMSPQTRLGYESMFLNIASPPIGESWVFTEEYQLQVDILMLKYMEDFPPSSWMVGEDVAEHAFRNFRHRVSMRQIGVKIYSTERLPEILRGTNGLPTVHNSRPEPVPAQTQPTQHTQHAPDPYAVPTYPDVPHQSHQTDHRVTPSNIPPHPVRPSPSANFNSAFAASILLSHTDDNRKKASKAKLPLLNQDSLDDDTDDDAEVTIRKHRYTSQPQADRSTPPYPQRERLSERKINLKPGRRYVRKQAEAETLPWHREIDFKKAKQEATWNDDYRNPNTIANMIGIRAHNTPIIEALDQEVSEKQRAAHRRYAKKRRGDDTSSDVPGKSGRKKKEPNNTNDIADTYHSGSFSFATEEDEQRANAVGCETPDDVVERGQADRIELATLEQIRLCWRPGKKCATHDLQQVTFTATESVITRKMLAKTPVITWKAAECIIDYCPDLLWRDILLRICSESGMGNKDVRDRFCLNGCHADKATFTKRISAALGQKQAQSKSKGYPNGEKEFYEQNSRDFDSYINFFGKRTTARHIKAAAKRRLSETATESSEMEDVIHVVSKKSRLADSGNTSLEDVDMADDVSVQDSDDLEGLSD